MLRAATQLAELAEKGPHADVLPMSVTSRPSHR